MRKFGAGLLVVIWIAGVCAGAGGVAVEVVRSEVGQYEKAEVVIEAGRSFRRPFDPCEVAVDLLVESPGGKSFVQPAFFCQDYERQDLSARGKTVAWYYPRGAGTWRARFAPFKTGTYTLRARVREKEAASVSAAPASHTGTCMPIDADRYCCFCTD